MNRDFIMIIVVATLSALFWAFMIQTAWLKYNDTYLQGIPQEYRP